MPSPRNGSEFRRSQRFTCDDAGPRAECAALLGTYLILISRGRQAIIENQRCGRRRGDQIQAHKKKKLQNNRSLLLVTIRVLDLMF